MQFRLGYVAMTLNLKDCSPSGTITVSAFNKLPSREARMYALRRITAKNLENTLRILRYNQAYHIPVYRFTSKLIPLATHPDIDDWDYAEEFSGEFKAIGDFVRENDFRVSAHPDHFTLINSSNPKVLEDSIRDLDYHVRIYEAMGIADMRYKLVMHVGGLYKERLVSIERFKENFIRLPDRIRKRIILENDDKSYGASDVLGICRDLRIPMVLDIHHHRCVNLGEPLEELIGPVFDTWKGEYFPPKIHVSSPKSSRDFRSHADYINPEDFTEFLQAARKDGRDFDAMLEAKAKDTALLALSDQLADMEGINRVNEGNFEMKEN